jgi:hypothetical protein
MTTPAIYYVDITRTTNNIKFFVTVGGVTSVDTNDACALIVTEYY